MNDQPSARTPAAIYCDGEGPWRTTDSSGTALGGFLAGEPDPSHKPGPVRWALFADLALDTPAPALLPLVTGLTYGPSAGKDRKPLSHSAVQ